MRKTRQGQVAVEHSSLERGTPTTFVIRKDDLIWLFGVISLADTCEAVFRVAATQTDAILPPSPNLNSFQCFQFGSLDQNWSQSCRPTFQAPHSSHSWNQSQSHHKKRPSSQARRVQFRLQIQAWIPQNASTLVPGINAGSPVGIRVIGLQCRHPTQAIVGIKVKATTRKGQPSKTGAILPPNPSLDSFLCFHFGSLDQRWIFGSDQSFRHPTQAKVGIKVKATKRKGHPAKQDASKSKLELLKMLALWFLGSTLDLWFRSEL